MAGVKFDTKLYIATARMADAKVWKNKKTTWGNIVDMLKSPHIASIHVKEVPKLKPDEKAILKDAGGYFGGYLNNGRRNKKAVLSRQLIALDMDFAKDTAFDIYTLFFKNAALLHSTFSSTKAEPRYRLVIPLSHEVSPEEYEAVARYIAGRLNIEMFDDTTFEINRFMFRPCIARGAEYEFHFQDGPITDPKAILKKYKNWKDMWCWPRSRKAMAQVRESQGNQEDPLTKKGMIGAFCRSYGIEEAIEKFLPNEYVKVDGSENRYSYTKGSTTGGAVAYEDKFLYSHHNTDPASCQLCNAFDLVRIHKFGHKDIKAPEGTEVSKLKSFTEMLDLCAGDKKVKKALIQEGSDKAYSEFTDDLVEIDDDSDENWIEKLEVTRGGITKSNTKNIQLIFKNDPVLRRLYRYNAFTRQIEATRDRPWKELEAGRSEVISNVDYQAQRSYFDLKYGIVNRNTIKDVCQLEAFRLRHHPVREYLNKQEWDGVPRVDRLLIDYFGAEDNVYTREAIRKFCVGAVARVMEPGVQFDLSLVIVDPIEGKGKSSFGRILAKGWFSDSFNRVTGNAAFEQLQGVWILENPELAGFERASENEVRHYLTKRDDRYRPAYGETMEVYLRQVVFYLTTNKWEFLKVAGGNRRFMPVSVRHKHIKKSVMDGELESEVDQVWAEAMHYYKKGEALILSPEAEKIAARVREVHTVMDDRKGQVAEYLDTPLPRDYSKMDMFTRKEYFDADLTNQRAIKGDEVQREYVCIAQIWCECFRRDKKEMTLHNTADIKSIMRSLPDWEYTGVQKRFHLYGTQRCYKRVKIRTR